MFSGDPGMERVDVCGRPVGRRGAREAQDVEFLHQIRPNRGVLFLHHVLTPIEIWSKSCSFNRLTEFLHQKWQLSPQGVYVGVILFGVRIKDSSGRVAFFGVRIHISY